MASPGDFYNDLPPVSKLFGTACVATTVAVQFGILDPGLLILRWPLVFYKFQIWRLVSNFVFLGGFGFPFVIRLMMIIRYGVVLEKTTFEHRTADFAWMLVFAMTVMLICGLLIPMLSFAIYSAPLVFMLVYVWSRHNPDQPVNLMGMLQLKAFWLPWALMLVTMLMGGDPFGDFFGIVVGHTYYFLKELHPRAGGGDYLATPRFFRELVEHVWGNFGTVNPNYQAPRAAPRFFQGRGNRLGGQ